MSSPSAARMADKELKSRILWEQWIDIPERVLMRNPELREWNRLMKLRDEANRLKIDEEFGRVQQESVES